MIKLTISSPYVGTDKEITLDFTAEEWDNLDDEDRTDVINMHVWDYVQIDLEDENGGFLEW